MTMNPRNSIALGALAVLWAIALTIMVWAYANKVIGPGPDPFSQPDSTEVQP
jgi:hypothetical protein